MMNLLSGLGAKINSNAETLGYLAAVLTGKGDGQGIQDVLDIIQQAAAGNVHAPNIAELGTFIKMPGGPVINGIMAYGAGLVLESLGLPVVGKFGPAIKKGGQALAVGGTVLILAYSMTHQTPTGQQSFMQQAQPITSPYHYG